MATFNFSALTSGQAISFDVVADDLVFDQAAISAASLAIAAEGSHTRVSVASGTDAGKSIVLLNVSPLQLAQSNVQFANGSALFAGDNNVALNDNAANTLTGTANADLMIGFGGNDSLNGGGGNDWIEGGTGNDTLSGSGGQDRIAFREAGAANADTVNTFATNWDSIHFDVAGFAALGAVGRFAAGDVRFFAGAAASDADDRIVFNSATGQLWYDADGSGAGAAQLIATLAAGTTVAAADIWVFGTPATGGGTGSIDGTAGNDSLVGTSGNDTLNGFAGNDTLDGAGGVDRLDGGTGDDTYLLGEGADVIVDAGGVDTVIAPGANLPDGIENLILRPTFVESGGTGNASNNLIRVEPAVAGGIVYIDGAGGNDTIVGTGDAFLFVSFTGAFGNDSVQGAASGGVLDFGGAAGAAVVDFGAGTASSGTGSVVFSGIQHAIGSAFADRITVSASDSALHRLLGDSGNDTITGGAGGDELFGEGGWGHPTSGTGDDSVFGAGGNDAIHGDDGNDTLDGGAGNDTLQGDDDDAGFDQFVFTAAPGAANADHIVHFASGADRIRLDATVMGALGTSGDFTSADARFWASTTGAAHDADDRVVFDTTTGQLWYDADGNGAGAAQLIATVQSGAVAASDITVDNGTTPEPDPEPQDPVLFNGTAGADFFTGGGGNDTLNGNDGADTLVGGGGNDVINGNAGNDQVEGGAGNDTVGGSGGQDTYVFREAGAANADTANNFASNWDRILLDGSRLTALGAEGRFASGDARFWASATGAAHDADDRVLFNTSNGQLWYDADGSGAGAAQLIATFAGGATVIATDINVVGTPPASSAINGTAGNDSLTGTAGVDTINGFAGNDTLEGLGGADVLDGGSGDDRYVVTRGDVITDAGGIDTVVFNPSGEIFSGDPTWTLGAGLENLTLVGFQDAMGSGTSPRAVGNALDNVIRNDGQFWNISTIIDGGAGNDTLVGGASVDQFEFAAGGASYGNDSVDGGDSDDILSFFHAGSGVVVDFGAGTASGGGMGTISFVSVEQAVGSNFADRITAGPTRVAVSAGAGNDTLLGGAGDDALFDNRTVLSPGADNDSISGGGGNDYLEIGAGNDFADAGAGNDRIAVLGLEGYGSDTIAGGEGVDLLTFGGAGSAVSVDLGAGTLSGGGAQAGSGATLSGIEHLSFVVNHAVTMRGDIGANNLEAGVAADTLEGRAGNDTLTGGIGADQFVFASIGTANADQITDFTSGADRIRLDATVMTALGAGGNFAAGDARFWASSTGAAHDADDRVLYNTGTRQIWYDADGNGTGAAQLIATLQAGATLAATDISVDNGTTPSVINGTAGDDSLIGTAGNDTIDGLGGNDTLDGGEGADSLSGGDGNDLLISGPVDRESRIETMDGGLGNDTYRLDRDLGWGSSIDVVLADAGGQDTIIAGSGTWELDEGFENLVLLNDEGNEGQTRGIGNSGANHITGFSAWYVGTYLDGADGNDTLVGGDGRDTFAFVAGTGAIGADQVTGGSSFDWLDYNGARSAVSVDFRTSSATGGGNGGTGSVTFTGVEGARGSALADRMVANDGMSWIDERSSETFNQGPHLMGLGGNDTLLGGASGDELTGDGGTPPFGGETTGDDEIRGGGGNDSIDGGGGTDRLFGDAGDDTFFLYTWGNQAAGADTLDGGAGSDTLFYSESRSAIRVDLAANTATGGETGGAGALTLVGIENAQTGVFADVLVGNAGANVLTGNMGNDTLDGGAGNDTLEGDISFNRGGQDHYVFSVAPGAANADTIVTFESGTDKIRLDARVHASLGTTGNLVNGDSRFFAGAGANSGQDASDRVVFDTTTGQLWYDADGNGAGAAQLIATLAGLPNGALRATDIIVDNGTAGGGGVEITGTDASETLTGTAGDDTILGFGGEDRIEGRGGNDSMNGGAGFDTFEVRGAYGSDVIDGGSSNDTIWFDQATSLGAIQVDLRAGTLTGSGGSATLISIESAYGGRFDDRIVGSDALNGSLSGGLGNDTILGGSSSDQLTGDTGGSRAPVGNDSLDGGLGNDSFWAGEGADTLVGGAGDDQFFLSSWVSNDPLDSIDGGAGARDSIVLYTVSGPAEVDLAAGTLRYTGIQGVNANFTGIEDFQASDWSSNDRVTGSAVANRIQGGGGNDTLHGAGGADTLTGGAGSDRFLFREAGAANADQVGDFASGTDKLLFDPAAFSGLGAGGNFAAGDVRFWASTTGTAHDADDRVLYNSSTRQVLYDPDGNGGGAAQLVATLQAGATLAAADIFVGTDAPVAPRFTASTMVSTGTSSNRVDLLFMGDGYTASEIGTTYLTHINSTLDYFFNGGLLSDPLGRYEQFFNVHRIDVISNQSGADTAGNPRDTALGASFNGRSLTIDAVLATQVMHDSIFGTGIEAEMRLVPVNTDLYGGTGGTFATFSAANFNSDDVALHEAAHQFAHLGDQYSEFANHWTFGDPSNPDLTDDPSGAKWAQWLGYDQPGIGVIGAYEGGGGGYTTGIYRPSLNSKMRSLDQPFDAVGREAFILDFYELVDPLDGHLANTSGLANVDELWVDTIDPSIILVDWTVNGTTFVNAGERFSLSAHGFSEGSFTVSARAYDPTDWVRVADRSSLEESVSWSVTNSGGGGVNRVGTAGNDSLTGTNGNDTLDGLGGADTMNGMAGNDVYFVTTGDVLQDSGGIDTVHSGVNWTLAIGYENGVMTGTGAVQMQGNNADNHITGNSGNNYFNARAGNDTLLGGAGNDNFDMSTGGTASPGNDSIDGGTGTDTVDYDGYARSGVTASLATGVVTGGGDAGVGSASLASIERFVGGGFADSIAGAAAPEYLDGRAGNDTLAGAGGNDTLLGGAGNDFFVFRETGAANADTVTGFATGADRFHLDNAAMTALGADGNFVAGDARFFAGAGASGGQDASDRVVYNTATGQLWYDADGSGAAAAQLIATLGLPATVAATDIAVI